MKRGTTPTVSIGVDTDLRACSTVIMTIKDRLGSELSLGRDRLEISDCTVSALLTQSETLGFKAGELRIQLRALDENGKALASNVMHAMSEEILKEGEIV